MGFSITEPRDLSLHTPISRWRCTREYTVGRVYPGWYSRVYTGCGIPTMVPGLCTRVYPPYVHLLHYPGIPLPMYTSCTTRVYPPLYVPGWDTSHPCTSLGG